MNIVNKFTGEIILTIEKLEGANLCEADLCGANLCGADLRKANLCGADLCEANLCGANLCKANLCGADLRKANLCGADLCEADLREANLCGADLRKANLCGADLRGAKNYYPQLYCLRQMPSNIKLTLYKYVTLNLKSPISNKKITYKIGKEYIEDNFNSDEREMCGSGLSIATLQWCLINKDEDNIILECSFKVGDIVAIPFATDGKIRVRKMKVVRKLSEEDINKLLNSCN